MAHQVNNITKTIASLISYRKEHGRKWKSDLSYDFLNGKCDIPELNQFRNVHIGRLNRITFTMKSSEILEILLVNVRKTDMDYIRSDLRKMWRHDHDDYIVDYIHTLKDQGYKLTERQINSLYNVEGRD